MRAHANLPSPAAAGLPVDAATLYPEGDGFFGRRAKARRAKLLDGVADVLRRALAPGETVRYVARGIRYHLLEHLFGGAAVAQYHNMTALVLTERRLLLIQIGRRGRAGDIKNEVPLAAIHGAGKGLTGFRIRLADGTTLRFMSVPGRDRKRLRALLPGAGGPPSAQRSLVHLCPACLRPVPGPVGTALVCPHLDCRIPFRDPRKAARLSAVVPGLGDLYLRHHFFGSLEFLGSMLMLGVGIAFLLQGAIAREPSTLAGAAVVAAAVILLPRIIDHRLTLHMGRKGLVPLALAPAPGGQIRNLPSYPSWSPLLFVAGLAIAGAVAFLISSDLRRDAAVDAAAHLAARGDLDGAHARWAAIERGEVDEARRVKFALALLEAGDLEGAGAIEAQFDGAKIEASLAERWSAALSRERGAFDDYEAGVQALLGGDESAWARLDRAIAYFRTVKRPHLPASRGELRAHLAEGVLREPLAQGDLERARPWLEELADAPSAEVTALRAAYESASGAGAQARSTLAALDTATLSPPFQLLTLEARARVAEGAAERAAVRNLAQALPRDALDEGAAERLDALVERVR